MILFLLLFVPEMSRPIRPNLHTPNKGTSGSIAIAAAALQRLLYPVGDTTHDALSFFSRGSGSKKCLFNYFCHKIWMDKIEEAFA